MMGTGQVPKPTLLQQEALARWIILMGKEQGTCLVCPWGAVPSFVLVCGCGCPKPVPAEQAGGAGGSREVQVRVFSWSRSQQSHSQGTDENRLCPARLMSGTDIAPALAGGHLSL